MSLRTWRRQHGPDIVCQAEPVEVIGTWRVSTTLPTAMKMLVSAQKKADTLARNTFGHTCEVETCGHWIPQ
jgi:hypothetical protein